MKSNGLGLFLGAGLGAATMYYFDPQRGRYRRGKMRDAMVHAAHKSHHAMGVAGRDARNRALGTAASLRSSLSIEQPDDVVLTERVRSHIGRVVTHPSSIEVRAEDGVVTLAGPILKDEVPLLLECVYGVRGVRDVRSELEVHADPGRHPGLQGNTRPRPGSRSAFMQEKWSPTARALGLFGGAMATLYGLNKHGPGRLLLEGSGLLLMSRALTNLEVRRLLGIGVQRHAVDIQKSMCIHAPVNEVYALWNDFENFPNLMRHVRRVRRIEDGRQKEIWRWSVTGPTGTEFDYDAVVTAREKNRLLAWRTEEGALVQHAGRVRFIDNGDDTTTIDVKMTYNPVAGALGHLVARLFNADPKHQMDEDLMRVKSFLETGKTPHDTAGNGPARRRAREAGRHGEESWLRQGSA